MTAKRDARQQRLGRIHQAKKALNLAEPEYRALLVRCSAGTDGLGGLDSSANMSEAQHHAVLREMVRLGFKADLFAKRKRVFPGEPKDCSSRPLVGKVRALLADNKRPWSYAHRMAKHMFHVEKVEWLNDHDLHKLAAALQVDANRKGR